MKVQGRLFALAAANGKAIETCLSENEISATPEIAPSLCPPPLRRVTISLQRVSTNIKCPRNCFSPFCAVYLPVSFESTRAPFVAGTMTIPVQLPNFCHGAS